MLNEFSLGDRVMLRKPHACGGNDWLITRTGADIKVKCMQCGRLLMIDRVEFIRMGKKILVKAEAEEE